MPGPAAITSQGGVLRLDPVRLGVRGFAGARAEPGARSAVAHWIRDELREGERRVGPVRIGVTRSHQRNAATFGVRVSNTGPEPLFVESVCLGFRLRGLSNSDLRFLRNGWQSWSYTGTRVLDEGGEPEFPSGPWLRGMHHVVGSPPPDRKGWYESATVTAVGRGLRAGACVAGVLESGRCFGVVYLRREGADAVLVEVELRVEVPLDPGEHRELDPVRVALGEDANALLEAFAELWGHVAGARKASPFRVGWCSWYHFFHDVTEEDLLRNLEALAAARAEIPVDVVQLDDGYQRAIGDWLETNEKFPRGIAPLAAEIRAAGFTPGIWTAPFCVVSESRLYESHPEWLLRGGDELFRGTVHGVWTASHWVHALDTTQPAVVEHLRSVFRELTGMGFVYLKLDFLHVVAMEAEARDPRRTRAERLRDGLRAIRDGAGEEAFLLGCGSPLGPAVGIVDAMRIGPDVAPSWEHEGASIPGLEPALPSTRGALRSIVHRAWMHRRLWQNDPDCLMARKRKTRLTETEVGSLAAAIAETGGLVVVSDDVTELDSESRALIRDCAARAREVDGACGSERARVFDLLANDEPAILSGRAGLDASVCVVNGADEPLALELDLERLGVAAGGETLALSLAPHASTRRAFHAARELAVFCDFDGTFSIQDVGSTLAKRHIPERRDASWRRFERGELRAWEYTVEILDGFELPEPELESFLRTVELDPGSRALVSWCAERAVPFRILSDGFDRNIDFLKKLHGLDFDYVANHLRYEGGRWRIGPGHPNPACGCGTGICKGTIIAEWRAAHPNALCVHIGNGAVSDLCGAHAADWTFARISEKDTLAPVLRERGEPFTPFRTLEEVIRTFETHLGPAGTATRARP